MYDTVYWQPYSGYGYEPASYGLQPASSSALRDSFDRMVSGIVSMVVVGFVFAMMLIAGAR